MIKLGIVMDPIGSIDIKKDTSFALLLAAQQRGWQLYYMKMADISLRTAQVYGQTRLLQVQRNQQQWFNFSAEQLIPLQQLDVILVRKDPPFDRQYLYLTQLLELVEAAGTLVLNRPQALRDCNEKLFTAWFPELMPETIVTQCADHIRQFHAQYQEIILKPLDGMGGASVFHIRANDPNLGVIIETLTNHGSRYCMAQRYLSAIRDGDKRILVVNGEPIPYCLARIPQPGETRGNLAAGGSGEVQALTTRDWQIAQRVAPVLKKKGLLFVGLDVIGDRLTEINVTSPTCLQEIEAGCALPITDQWLDSIQQLASCANNCPDLLPRRP